MAQLAVENQIDRKRIAKNTLFLYFRMLLILGVTLFTSRVILEKLGATNFGIYGSVGGAVAMLGFLNGTLSTGTSRFLTFELSRGNLDKLKATFSTAFFTHLILSILVVLVLEVFGVWFINNKLIIPPERLSAAIWVLHISVFTTFISITQVPYTSVIIAHENMSIYAYVGIFDALAKLGIAYLLSLANWDRLIFYAFLVACVHVVVAFFYRYYCIRNYEESKLSLKMNIPIFKEMLSFSGWGLLANVSQILSTQGLVVIMNMFFQPVVVAAQTIGNQLSSAIMSFVNNFRIAINPQIIKSYAVEAYSESRKLTLETSVYVFELVLLFALPMFVSMKTLLGLWLVEVPQYTVEFSKYIVISQLLNVYNNSFYIPMAASGKLKENSYASLALTLIVFTTLYILLKNGADVMWVQYANIFQIIMLSFVIKPVILCRYIPDYTWKLIFINELECLRVAAIPIIITIIINRYLEVCSFLDIVAVTLIIGSSVCISAFIFMKKANRAKLLTFLKTKILKK